MTHPELACFDQTYLILLDGGAAALVYQTYRVKPGWTASREFRVEADYLAALLV
jgi:hypothetical protein